jgi:Glycosyl hydrolase family 99
MQPDSSRRRLVTRIGVAILGCICTAMSTTSFPAPASAHPTGSSMKAPATVDPIPLLAYYYIWYNHNSWNRGKTDYPVLGRYSSGNKKVMTKHIRWAKQAGIDGFIVSWKSTQTLNRRLARLVRIADRQHFKLVLMYEGLDFFRKPLAEYVVSADLKYFVKRYGNDPAFRLFGKRPLVIWSGTWEYTTEEVSLVTHDVGKRLLIIASEHNSDDYQRLKGVVGGDAYYWASVNPRTYPGYQAKLDDMARVVHASHGLWFAPAAPGFDARSVGGQSIVNRDNGATLRTEMNVAMRSSPDAIGLISWNEFSENTQIEPSVNLGSRYLDVVADIQNTAPPKIPDFDSSQPSGIDVGRISQWFLLGTLGTLTLLSLVVIARRRGEEE